MPLFAVSPTAVVYPLFFTSFSLLRSAIQYSWGSFLEGVCHKISAAVDLVSAKANLLGSITHLELVFNRRVLQVKKSMQQVDILLYC